MLFQITKSHLKQFFSFFFATVEVEHHAMSSTLTQHKRQKKK